MVRSRIALALIIAIASPTLASRADDAPEEKAPATPKTEPSTEELIATAKRAMAVVQQPGASTAQQNESAITALEAAARQLAASLKESPDSAPLRQRQLDVDALLYWCHKMAPISARRSAAFQKQEARRAKQQRRRGKNTLPGSEPTSPASLAEAALEATKAYEKGAAPEQDRKLECLTRYFEIASRYPGTPSGAEANQATLRLQRALAEAESPSEPRPAGALARLGPVIKRYVSARKSLLCKRCDGSWRIACRKCKGKKWKLRPDHTKRGGINWEASTPCPSCNKKALRPLKAYRRKKQSSTPRDELNAGTTLCGYSNCRFGFDLRRAKVVLYDLQGPAVRTRLREALGSLPEEELVAAQMVLINPACESGREAHFKELADRTGRDASFMVEALAPLVRQRRYLTTVFDRLTSAQNGEALTLKLFKKGSRTPIAEETRRFRWVADSWVRDEAD